jgi:hypothetical protein
MLESSKDVLFIALALCSLWLTIFVCWSLWYIITMLRDAHKLVKSVREKMETVDAVLSVVRDKLEEGSSHLGMIADTILRFGGYFLEKKMKSATSSSRTKKGKS